MQYDTAQRIIIKKFLDTKTKQTKQINPLVSGPGQFKWWKKNWGLKSRWTVHLNVVRNLYVLLHVVQNLYFSFAYCVKFIYSLACCAESLNICTKLYMCIHSHTVSLPAVINLVIFYQNSSRPMLGGLYFCYPLISEMH